MKYCGEQKCVYVFVLLFKVVYVKSIHTTGLKIENRNKCKQIDYIVCIYSRCSVQSLQTVHVYLKTKYNY